MKKLNIFILFLLICSSFSCEKDEMADRTIKEVSVLSLSVENYEIGKMPYMFDIYQSKPLLLYFADAQSVYAYTIKDIKDTSSDVVYDVKITATKNGKQSDEYFYLTGDKNTNRGVLEYRYSDEENIEYSLQYSVIISKQNKLN